MANLDVLKTMKHTIHTLVTVSRVYAYLDHKCDNLYSLTKNKFYINDTLIHKNNYSEYV